MPLTAPEVAGLLNAIRAENTKAAAKGGLN